MQHKRIGILIGKRGNSFYFCDWIYRDAEGRTGALLSTVRPLSLAECQKRVCKLPPLERACPDYEHEVRKEGFKVENFPVVERVNANVTLDALGDEELDFDLVYDPYFFAQILELR